MPVFPFSFAFQVASIFIVNEAAVLVEPGFRGHAHNAPLSNKVLSKDAIMANMTVQNAIALFMGMANHGNVENNLLEYVRDTLVHQEIGNLRKVGRHSQLVEKAQAVETPGRLIEKITALIEQCKKKQDFEMHRCEVMDKYIRESLKQSQAEISTANSEATILRGEVLRLRAGINEITNLELSRKREELEKKLKQCIAEKTSLNQKLEMQKHASVAANKVEDNFDCEIVQHVNGDETLMQLYAMGSKEVRCRSCIRPKTGKTYTWLQHNGIDRELQSLESTEARKLLAAVFAGTPYYGLGGEHVALAQSSQLPVTGVAACNEKMDADGSMYRGCRDTSVHGLSCQMWTSTAAHNHSMMSLPNATELGLGDHNYCRNPDGKGTIWCFTIDPNLEWDYCEPKLPSDFAVPNIEPCVEMTACDFSASQCDQLLEKFLELSGGMTNAVKQTMTDLSTLETSCERTQSTLTTQIDQLTMKLQMLQSKLAVELSALALASEKSMSLGTLYKETGERLHSETDQCCRTKNSYTSQLCALNVIRGELAESSGIEPQQLPIDCEVGNWQVEQTCTVPCGGGERVERRPIIQAAQNGGAGCGPLQQVISCNEHACPIHCELGVWEQWGSCSAQECGGGLRERSRPVLQPAQSGGTPCELTSQTEECNTKNCNMPCVLGDWETQGGCSKSCATGHLTKIRPVVQRATGLGNCPPEDAKERLDEKTECNTHTCESLLVDAPILECSAQLDLLILLDGTASMQQRGWDLQKSAVDKLLTHVQGEDMVHLDVVVFSGPKDTSIYKECVRAEHDAKTCGVDPLMNELTNDITTVHKKFNETTYPAGTAMFTAIALTKAKEILLRGRPGVNKVVLVFTDGIPWDGEKTATASENVKLIARLLFVAFGSLEMLPAGQGGFMDWASRPSIDNVMAISDMDQLSTSQFTNNLMGAFCPSVH